MRRNRHLSRGAPDDRGHETASPAATQRAIAEHQIRFRAMNERIEAAADAPQEELLALARGSERVRQHIDGREVVKEIVVAGKLVNLVVR